MKKIATIIAAFLALMVIPGVAHAATTITPSATTVTVGDTLTLTVDGPVVITAGSFLNTLYTSTGACTTRQYGSYSNGGQKTEYNCTGPDVLSGKTNNSGVQAFYGDAGQSVIVTVKALPVAPPPPPAPAPKVVLAQSTCSGTYVVTLTNIGNADAVNTSYSDTYCTPPVLSAVSIPAGSTITYRTVCNRFHSCYRSNGFVVKGFNVPVGATVTISFAVA